MTEELSLAVCIGVSMTIRDYKEDVITPRLNPKWWSGLPKLPRVLEGF